jgi:hypothetical protein
MLFINEAKLSDLTGFFNAVLQIRYSPVAVNIEFLQSETGTPLNLLRCLFNLFKLKA